jgi:hypothetical protein
MSSRRPDPALFSNSPSLSLVELTGIEAADEAIALSPPGI